MESDTHLKNTCEELSEKHQTEMMELQKTLETELEKIKGELGLLSLENKQSKSKHRGEGVCLWQWLVLLRLH